jgi:hypothetical protein
MTAGATQRGSDNLPLGSVVTPGIATPAVLQGGTQTGPDANGVTTAPGVMALSDGFKATFSACITAQVPVTTAGDCFVLNWVSKVIRLTRIQVTGTATTATTLDVTLVRRSTADTAGTSTTPTIVPHDSGNPAVTATVKAYTVAPTAGTLVGIICAEKLLLAVPAATGGESQVEWIFGNRPSQSPVLRAAGLFAVTISAIPSGGSMTISMEWTEE